MAGIDEVLERLVADGGFRAALARDPGAALAGYDLTRDDIELLASSLDDGDDAERTVEQRTSRSAMLALLSSFVGPGGGGTAGPEHDPTSQPEPGGTFNFTVEITSGSDEVDPDALTHKVDPDGTAPDDAADDRTHKAEVDVLSWSWGAADAADDLAVPLGDEPLDPALADGGDKPEEAAGGFLKIGDVKGESAPPESLPEPGGDFTFDVEVTNTSDEIAPDPDALTHKVDPGGGGGEEAIGDGLEDDGPAEMENVGLNYGKVQLEAEPLDPALAGAEGEPEADPQGQPTFTLVGPDPDAGDHTVDPGGGGGEGAIVDGQPETVDESSAEDEMGAEAEDDDSVVEGPLPDGGVVGGNPPDDSLEGVTPPDDGVVRGNPPDDTLEGVRGSRAAVTFTTSEDDLGAPTDVTAAMDVDDVMDIEDM